MADEVAYALLGDELVRAQRNTPWREREYLCPACKKHVFIKPGKKLAPHFSHYSGAGANCEPETIAHEAAKYKLAHHFRKQQISSLPVLLPCRGYRDRNLSSRDCPHHKTFPQKIDVSRYDNASVEVSKGDYWIDAATTTVGLASFGLEVLHTHQVDDEKAAYLSSPEGIPWLEFESHPVLNQQPPWTVVNGSTTFPQCQHCQELAAREGDAYASERAIPLARAGDTLYPPGLGVSEHATCPACNHSVKARVVAGHHLWVHTSNPLCTGDQVLTGAALWLLATRLEAKPSSVALVYPCRGADHHPRSRCLRANNLQDDYHLGAFDEVLIRNDHATLRNNGVTQLTITFERERLKTKLDSELILNRDKYLSDPDVWTTDQYQKEGRRCPYCEEYRERIAKQQELARRRMSSNTLTISSDRSPWERERERLRALAKNAKSHDTKKAQALAHQLIDEHQLELTPGEWAAVVRYCANCDHDTLALGSLAELAKDHPLYPKMGPLLKGRHLFACLGCHRFLKESYLQSVDPNRSSFPKPVVLLAHQLLREASSSQEA